MNRRSLLISLTLLCMTCASSLTAQTILSFQDSGAYYAPHVTQSGRLYFQSNRYQGYRVYEAEADTLLWTWPKSNPLRDNLPSGYILSGGPSLSVNEDTLYFCAVLPAGKGDMDIWYSVKQGDGSWGAATSISGEINTDRYEGFPSISPDGKLLFFTRQKGTDNAGSGCSDIYVAKRTGSGWGKPQKLAIGGNYGCVKAPHILPDNKTLLFASEFPEGKGGYELLKAEYKNDALNNITTLDFINSEKHENGATLYNDREILIYVQNNKLYQYKIPYDKWIIKEIYLSVSTRDKALKANPWVTADVSLTNADGSITLKKDSTRASVSFQYTLTPYSDYKLRISAQGYQDTIITLPYTQDPVTKTQKLVIDLQPKTQLFVVNVTDAETNIGLDVDIIVTDLDLNEKVTYSSSDSRDGKYAVALREGHRYDIEVASSQGYAYSRTQVNVPQSSLHKTDSASFGNTGNTSTQLNMPVTPLKAGRKLELKDIYFDYNSYTLSEASHPELDRVVELMKDNPAIYIEISAHTDNKGTADYNVKLSDKRAQEIVKYLVSKGVPSARLKPKGYGAAKPVAPNDTEENRAKNRRVELKVISARP